MALTSRNRPVAMFSFFPLFLFLFFASVAVALLAVPFVSGQGVPPDLSQHPPIVIESDLDFRLPGSGVRSGMGSQSDPFVISGWIIKPEYHLGPIDMSGHNGIVIKNTEAHYRVENVSIQGDFSEGIVLGFTQNGHFTDIHIQTETSEPMGGAVWVDASSNIEFERVLIEHPSRGFQISDALDPDRSGNRVPSNDIRLSQVLIKGVDELGIRNALRADRVEKLTLTDVVAINPLFGMNLEVDELHMQGVHMLGVADPGFLIRADDVVAQDIVVIRQPDPRFPASWSPSLPAISWHGSGHAVFQDLQLIGGVFVESDGGRLELRSTSILAPATGEGDALNLRGLDSFHLDNVTATGFWQGINVSPTDESKTVGTMDSVRFEGLGQGMLGATFREGSSISAQDLTIRGHASRAIGMSGAGPFSFRGLVVENNGDSTGGGGVHADGVGVVVEIEDSVFRGNQRGVEVKATGDVPSGRLRVVDSLIEHNRGGVTGTNLLYAEVSRNSFTTLFHSSVSVRNACSYRVEDNQITSLAAFLSIFLFNEDAAVDATVGSCAGAISPRLAARNTIIGGEAGLFVLGRHVELLDNTISDQLNTGLLVSATSSEIRGNVITGQKREGMKLATLIDSIVADNIVTRSSGVGINASGERTLESGGGFIGVLEPERVSGNVFSGNVVTDHALDGMSLAGLDNTVTSNTFARNGGFGLKITAGGGNTLLDNMFDANTKGDLVGGTEIEGPEHQPARRVTPWPGLGPVLLVVLVVTRAVRARDWATSTT